MRNLNDKKYLNQEIELLEDQYEKEDIDEYKESLKKRVYAKFRYDKN